MKKNELLLMLIRDLKALAKKLKISVPERAKKADIVETILAGAKINKKAPVKKAAPKKAGRPAAQAAKAESPRKRDDPERTRAPKNDAPRKQAAPKRAPAPKTTEPAAAVYDWKVPPSAEEPLLAQERVSDSKYYTGPAQQAAVAERSELPRSYGRDRIVLMTRDPFVLHAYWEATPERIEREKAWFGWDSKLSVRIYDVTGVQFDGRNAAGYFDQEVSERSGTWYFDLGRPSHSFCADLGLLSSEGQFLTLARSNYVTMPRDGVSNMIDEEWMLADEEFWKLYGYPEDRSAAVSSPGRVRQDMEGMKRRRVQGVSSPGLFARERAKARRK